MIDVEVHADTRWLAVPLDSDVDLDAWAAEATSTAYQMRDVTPSDDERTTTAAVYAGLGRMLAEAAADPDEPVEAAFALTAADDPLPVTVATGRRLECPSGTSADDVIGALLLPAEDRYDEPVIEEIETPAGHAVRIVQRTLVPIEDGDLTVQEWQAYLWVVPDAEAALLLTVQFVDLMDAAVFDEDVRHLVAGVLIST